MLQDLASITTATIKYTQKFSKSKGNSLCIYFKQTKKSFFFFYIIGVQKVRTGPVWEGWYHRREKEVGKGCGRVNIMQKSCNHVCKWKNYTC
jgi:hypothetical protein